MRKPIVLKEYESDKDELSKADLQRLQIYLERLKLTSALRVTPLGVQAKYMVGVIKCKNIQIQILPKLICENDEDRCILKNLIYMLSFTKKLDIKANEAAKLANTRNPFLEVLIREYANSLFECLKRLTPKKYVREEDNLTYLRGKLKFTENIRYNAANQAKFYCEYDEFSENNILNQLFLFVATCLYNISGDGNNRKILKFIINYYSDIELQRFDKFKVNKIILARNQKLFQKPFNLAKMFIENASVDLSCNKFENITLVWDMNKLFEEFIFEVMKKYSSELGYTPTAQKHRKLLVDENNSTLRSTYVDIMLKKHGENEEIVLDTKYKKFEKIDDFSDNDVFQVSSYCLLHGADHAILLYPQWMEKIDIPAYNLNTVRDNKFIIEFKTINLKYKDMKEHIEDIKEEIAHILQI